MKKPNKKQINQYKIKSAKFLAFVVLIIAASYGFKSMLETLQEPVQLLLTIVCILALVFIITLGEDK